MLWDCKAAALKICEFLEYVLWDVSEEDPNFTFQFIQIHCHAEHSAHVYVIIQEEYRELYTVPLYWFL